MIGMRSRCSITSFPRVSSSAIIPLFLLLLLSIICSFAGCASSAVVTLQSIEIYESHEWLHAKPTVYFSCKGENKTILPDVKETNVLYDFRGEESWQPLTELSSKKCKRCGFYEQDLWKLDDTFDEWELCPSDFTDPDGKYTHVKDEELNVTFSCPDCVNHTEHDTQDVDASSDHHKGARTRDAIIILVSVVAAVIVVIGLVAAHRFWLKRKRQQEQARFLKLFEEGDDIEDELGLSDFV
ncbi:hypothetical protein Droror1_Dr00026141 [Drosera rotundifolia]